MAIDANPATADHAHHHAHGPANRGRRVLRTAAPLFVRFPAVPTGAGVVVLHDVYGLTEAVENTCRRLAAAGYTAVAPYLYYATGGKEFRPEHETTARAAMSLLSPDDLATDVLCALDYLNRRIGIPAHLTALLRIGMGGHMAGQAPTVDELAGVATYDPRDMDRATIDDAIECFDTRIRPVSAARASESKWTEEGR